MDDVIIKNGLVVRVDDTFRIDLLIATGIVARIAENLDEPCRLDRYSEEAHDGKVVDYGLHLAEKGWGECVPRHLMPEALSSKEVVR